MNLVTAWKWIAAAMLLGLAACADGPSTPQTNPGSLQETAIPADFTFQTNRAIRVAVSASPAMVQQGAALEIVRADGRRLYRGPIQADRAVVLDAVIPTKDNTVSARLLARDEVRTAQIDVSSGNGVTRFE